jgi:hypothetical protein
MLQKFINHLEFSFHQMDGLEKAAFSFWAVGTIVFWGIFIFLIGSFAKTVLTRLFKRAK